MTSERPNPLDPQREPVSEIVPVEAEPVEVNRITRRIEQADRHPLRTKRTAHEQITALTEALGDTGHPLHAGAVDELVALGSVVIPALCGAIRPDQPWLTVYRAAEVAGRIRDGRATGALIQAIRHPNSNVRWSVVRALAQIGDVRALLELRRVAQQDQGRTSWGESIAGTAQSALNELSRNSVWGQSIELAKNAAVAVLMIVALVLAYSVINRLRNELELFGQVIPGQTQVPQFTLPTSTIVPTSVRPTALSLNLTQPTRQASLAPTTPIMTTNIITGTVLQDANVRPLPDTNNQPIGRLTQGDEIVFQARTPGSEWYLVGLGTLRGPNSRISSSDGTGWVSSSLLTAPGAELPVRELPSTATPEATATATTTP